MKTEQIQQRLRSVRDQKNQTGAGHSRRQGVSERSLQGGTDVSGTGTTRCSALRERRSPVSQSTKQPPWQTAKRQQTDWWTQASGLPGASVTSHHTSGSCCHRRVCSAQRHCQTRTAEARAGRTRYSHKGCGAACAGLDRQNVCVSLVQREQDVGSLLAGLCHRQQPRKVTIRIGACHDIHQLLPVQNLLLQPLGHAPCARGEGSW